MSLSNKKIKEIAENTAILTKDFIIDNIEWQTASVRLHGVEYDELNKKIFKKALKLLLKSIK